MNSSRRTGNPVEVGSLDMADLDNDLEELILDPGEDSKTSRNKKSTQNTNNTMFAILKQPYRDPLRQPQYVYSNVSRIKIKPDSTPNDTSKVNGELKLNLNGNDLKTDTVGMNRSGSNVTTSAQSTPNTSENSRQLSKQQTTNQSVKTDPVRMRPPSDVNSPEASQRQRNGAFLSQRTTNRTARNKVDKNEKGFSHEERDMYVDDLEDF